MKIRSGYTVCVMWTTVPGFVMYSFYLCEQLVRSVLNNNKNNNNENNNEKCQGLYRSNPTVWVTVTEAALYLAVRSNMNCCACVWWQFDSLTVLCCVRPGIKVCVDCVLAKHEMLQGRDIWTSFNCVECGHTGWSHSTYQQQSIW